MINGVKNFMEEKEEGDGEKRKQPIPYHVITSLVPGPEFPSRILSIQVYQGVESEIRKTRNHSRRILGGGEQDQSQVENAQAIRKPTFFR